MAGASTREKQALRDSLQCAIQGEPFMQSWFMTTDLGAFSAVPSVNEYKSVVVGLISIVCADAGCKACRSETPIADSPDPG
jgi:hypothetical protein